MDAPNVSSTMPDQFRPIPMPEPAVVEENDPGAPIPPPKTDGSGVGTFGRLVLENATLDEVWKKLRSVDPHLMERIELAASRRGIGAREVLLQLLENELDLYWAQRKRDLSEISDDIERPRDAGTRVMSNVVLASRGGRKVHEENREVIRERIEWHQQQVEWNQREIKGLIEMLLSPGYAISTEKDSDNGSEPF